jgi:hypothetical protein
MKTKILHFRNYTTFSLKQLFNPIIDIHIEVPFIFLHFQERMVDQLIKFDSF